MAKAKKVIKLVARCVRIVKTPKGTYGIGFNGEEITIQRANAIIAQHGLKNISKPDVKPNKTIYTYE